MRCIFKGRQVPLFGDFSNELIYSHWMLYSSQCWFNSEFVFIVFIEHFVFKKKEKVKDSLLVLPDPKHDGLITSSTGLLMKVLASPDNRSAYRPDSVKFGSSRSWSSYSEQVGRNNIKKKENSQSTFYLGINWSALLVKQILMLNLKPCEIDYC